MKKTITIFLMILFLPCVLAAYQSSTDWLAEYPYYDTALTATLPQELVGYVTSSSNLQDYCSITNRRLTGFPYVIENETSDRIVIAQTRTTVELIDPKSCEVLQDIVPVTVEAQLAYYSLSNGTKKLAVPNSNQTFTIIVIANNTFTEDANVDYSSTGETIRDSGVVCAYTNGHNRCYYQSNHNNLVMLNLDDNTVDHYHVINTTYNDTNRDRTPALRSWSGTDHIAIAGIYNISGDSVASARVCVWTPDTESMYTIFDSDGCVTPTTAGNLVWFISNPLISKYGSGSAPQITVAMIDRTHPGGTDAHLGIKSYLISYDITGTVLYSVLGSNVVGTAYGIGMSNPFVLYNDTNDVGTVMHCALFDNRMTTSTFPGFNFYKEILCVGNHGTSSATLISRVQNTVAPSTAGMCYENNGLRKCNAYVGDFAGSLPGKEILTPESYWNTYITDSTLSATQLATVNLTMNYSSQADIDSDNVLDWVYNSGTGLFMKTSYINNTPPVLDSTKQYGGYYNYMSPACVDTVTTFKAQECTLAVPTDCNYDNDNEFDQERMLTDCDFTYNDTVLAGDWDIDNPSFDCYFNETGVHNVRIYLQDNHNNDNYDVYNTESIPVDVIDGEPGVTCNIESTLIVTPDYQPNATSTDPLLTDVDDFLCNLGVCGTLSRIIIALIAIMIVSVGVYMKTQNTVMSGGAAIITMLITYYLDLIGIFPFFIIIMAAIALVVYRLTGSGTQTG